MKRRETGGIDRSRWMMRRSGEQIVKPLECSDYRETDNNLQKKKKKKKNMTIICEKIENNERTIEQNKKIKIKNLQGNWVEH